MAIIFTHFKKKTLIFVFNQKTLSRPKTSKLAYDKNTKPKSYALGKKVWLNNKYTKLNKIKN